MLEGCWLPDVVDDVIASLSGLLIMSSIWLNCQPQPHESTAALCPFQVTTPRHLPEHFVGPSKLLVIAYSPAWNFQCPAFLPYDP